jgi:hypothetical protein
MSPTFKNVLSIILGIVIGSIVNMGIINISGKIIPAPKGVDVTTLEGLRSTMHLFEPKHFLFPFLAHALGTLVGAFVAAFLAVNYKMRFALVISILFLLGGIANTFMLPSPIWYTILDLVAAYIPMGLLGWKIAEVIKK